MLEGLGGEASQRPGKVVLGITGRPGSVGTVDRGHQWDGQGAWRQWDRGASLDVQGAWGQWTEGIDGTSRERGNSDKESKEAWLLYAPVLEHLYQLQTPETDIGANGCDPRTWNVEAGELVQGQSQGDGTMDRALLDKYDLLSLNCRTCIKVGKDRLDIVVL